MAKTGTVKSYAITLDGFVEDLEEDFLGREEAVAFDRRYFNLYSVELFRAFFLFYLKGKVTPEIMSFLI